MLENSIAVTVTITKRKIKKRADLRWTDNIKALKQWTVNYEQNLRAFKRLRSKHSINNECFNDARKTKSSEKRLVSFTNIKIKRCWNIWTFKRSWIGNK